MVLITNVLDADNRNMARKILVTGANGQLGRCIRDLSNLAESAAYEICFTDVEELDICEKDSVAAFVEQHHIEVIINAAAYTAVDKAEDERDMAFRLNRDAVRNLAEVARDHGAYLIHVSTDYVFSGEHCHPYKVDDEIAPKSVYGASKFAGEEAMRESGCNGSIIRTAWLYSEYGRNFVKTMLQKGRECDVLRVVTDQVGGPTYAGDLARAIFKVLSANLEKRGVQTYHYANEGVISWFDFTQAIVEIAGLDCKVMPIFSSEFAAKAQRPAYSVFDLTKIKSDTGIDIPYWKHSLKLIINKLNKE